MNTFVAIVLSLAPLSAVPVPDRRDDGPRDAELTNTTWIGVDKDWVTTYRFEPGGVLHYSYTTGTFRNGTWRVEGRTLYYEINKKVYEFRGTIYDDTIIGESWNVRGDHWSHILRRRQ